MAIQFDPSASDFDPTDPTTFPSSLDKIKEVEGHDAHTFDTIYSGTYDSKGHSRRFTWGPRKRRQEVCLPSHEYDEIMAIKAKWSAIYDNNTDIVKDAMGIWRKVRRAQIKHPEAYHEIVEILERFTAWADTEQQLIDRQRHEDQLEDMEQMLLAASRDPEELAHAVLQAERAAMLMSFPSFRRQAATVIDRYRR